MTLHDVQRASYLLVHRWVDLSSFFAKCERAKRERAKRVLLALSPFGERAKRVQTEGVGSHMGFCEDGS